MSNFDKARLYADIADRDDLIAQQQQQRIAELELAVADLSVEGDKYIAKRDAEVSRKAFLDGFYSSGEGFNGEYGGDKDILDKLANEYAERVKRG